MKQRFLLLSAFVLFSSIIGDTPRSLAATNDPASVVGDLGSRAIAALQNGDTAAAKQEQFRQLFRQYFDVEACARFALGTIGLPRPRCSGRSSSNFTRITSSPAIPPPSAPSAAQASRC